MVLRLQKLKIDWTDLKKVSVIVLILTNLFPIYGVLFLDWQVFPILVLFWIENVIVGISTVLKMVLSTADKKGQLITKISMIPFFCFHYGLFTLGHGFFILVLFGGIFDPNKSADSLFDNLGNLLDSQLWWAVLGLMVSHCVSFAVNYIGKGEYKYSGISQLMAQPYGRVVILHITIIFSGFLVMLLGSPVIGLILLIGLKIFVDIKAHIKQHSVFSVP